MELVAALPRWVWRTDGAAICSSNVSRDSILHVLPTPPTTWPTFTAFPKQHWHQICSNRPQERLNRELQHRTDIVGIFPDREAVTRLIGRVLTEQDDEWATARLYMGADSLTKARFHIIEGELK